MCTWVLELAFCLMVSEVTIYDYEIKNEYSYI